MDRSADGDKMAWADKAEEMHLILRTRGACAPQARRIARVYTRAHIQHRNGGESKE